MAEPRPDIGALVRAGRAAFRPQRSDRERVLQSLARALGDGAGLEGPQNAEPSKSLGPRFPVRVRAWVLGGVGALSVGAAVVVAARPGTKTSSQAAPPVASSIPTAVPPLADVDDHAAQPRAEAPSSAPRLAARSAAARASSDSLPEEVLLLSRAEQQLNSGHADEALKTLAEHERRFPSGALAEERVAARVQSLCALGRVAEARAELTKLARAYPRSPHLDRARRFCGIDAP